MRDPSTTKHYLSRAEAADYLGISLRWLEYLRRGTNPPPAFKLGQKLLFRASELDAWIEHYRIGKTVAHPDNAPNL
jgi:excisionase family DNA binding protein